ncbi:MAG: EscU/YscU/HrcU family type III secretion system export apparatus switch protein [Rhodothalassiaceae bacterium]
MQSSGQDRQAGRRPAAVALKDAPDRPRLTAKGHGHVAEKILAIAFAHGVKVRQDAALTDILAAFEVDSPIPLEAVDAVSEILSYVYRADQEAAR